MSSVQLPTHATEPCHIKSNNPKKGYWQCGMWVQDVHDATVYTSPDEAQQVIFWRHLPNCIVVAAA